MAVLLGSRFFPAFLAIGALACGSPAPRPATPDGSGATVQVEKTQPAAAPVEGRRSLHVALGLHDEAAVFRDQRALKVGVGNMRLAVRGVPTDLENSYFALRSLTSGAKLDVLESRPYTAPITPEAILSSNIGKPVTAYLPDAATGKDAKRSGILLGVSAEGPVVSVDGEVRLASYDRLSIAALPEGLRREPSVEFLVRSDREEQEVELVYTSKQVKGAMEYHLVRAPRATTAQLTGVAAIVNESSSPLVNATFSLSQEKLQPSLFAAADGKSADAEREAAEAKSLTTFVRLLTPMTINAGEKTSFRVFGPSDVNLTRKLVMEGVGFPTNNGPDEYGNSSMQSVLDARTVNGTAISSQGMLPGRAHLFERADAEPPRSYGTSPARPLPEAKGLRIDLGREDKFVTHRKLVAKKTLGRCVVETSWDITVSNPTDEATPLEDVEPVSGKYELLDSSVPPIAKELDHFAFQLMLPPNGESRLKFKVRTLSCVTERRSYWNQNWSKGMSKPYYPGSGGKS